MSDDAHKNLDDLVQAIIEGGAKIAAKNFGVKPAALTHTIGVLKGLGFGIENPKGGRGAGPKSKVDVAEATELLNNGCSPDDVARRYGVKAVSLRAALKKAKVVIAPPSPEEVLARLGKKAA